MQEPGVRESSSSRLIASGHFRQQINAVLAAPSSNKRGVSAPGAAAVACLMQQAQAQSKQ
jgi:hypothetical protein